MSPVSDTQKPTTHVTPILMTKLAMPPTRTQLTPRTRLLDRLTAGAQRKLTLISAPAGFGKTTLVASWLNQKDEGRRIKDELSQPSLQPSPLILQPFEVAWLSLDDSDDNPARFWTYVINALQTVQPAFGVRTLDMLVEPQLPNLETALILLINDMATHSSPLVLVLDDYHVINDDVIHSSLAFLLDHLPPQLHLIITSRIDPPLPLPRLRARNQLNEFRVDDLRFTAAEAASFLNQTMGLSLSPQDVAALEARTEGWVAGLQLAAVSMQGRSDVSEFIATFTGSHQYVLDYLAQEVFEQQPPPVQTFLLKTSILARLTGPLCDAVTGDANGQEMLERLAAANLFVTRLDDRRQWYRYHRLFVDLLRYRLPQAGIDERELHRRASAWYEQAGIIDKAIKYALAAKDYDRVNTFLLENIETFFFEGKKSLLLDWIQALPDPYIDRHPLLGLAAAWILFLNGNLAASAHHLDKVEPQLTGHPVAMPALVHHRQSPISHISAGQIPGVVAALRGQLLLLQGHSATAIEQFHTALSYLPPDALGIRGLIIQHLGMAYWLSGDFEAADRVYLEFQPQAGHDIGRVFVTLNQADRHHIRGHLNQAASLYQHAIAMSEHSGAGLAFNRAAASAELGMIHYEWNDLETAEQYFRDGIRLGQNDISIKAVGVGHYGLAVLLGVTGQFDEAFKTYEELIALTSDMDLGISIPIIKSALLKLLIEQGDLPRLRREMQSFAFARNAETSPGHLRVDWIIGCAHFVLGQFDEALQLGKQFLLHKAADYNLVGAARVRALLALVYQQQGDALQSQQMLSQALTLAQPENMVRTFLDYGPPMADLLSRFQKTARPEAAGSPLPGFVDALLAAFPGAPAPVEPTPSAPAQLPALPEPLTERELEVLQLMARGLTNKEIAQKLVITTGTVKVHTSHIYGKLDVNNRTQAVARARTVGLLA